MPTTFNYSGKPAFMYDQETDVWLQLGGAIDTSAGYTWTGVHAFSSDASFADSLTSREGINNFLNPAARNAAITSPVHGTVAFVRQDAGGNTINQWQYYDGSSWVANDGDISGVTAGTGLSGGGTSGDVTVSFDYSVGNQSIESAQTASYTLVLGDAGKLVTVSNASANNLTVPPNSSVAFPTGTRIDVIQKGAGQTTIVAGAGVTLNSKGSALKLSGQYAGASLIKYASDTWFVVGDLTA